MKSTFAYNLMETRMPPELLEQIFIMNEALVNATISLQSFSNHHSFEKGRLLPLADSLEEIRNRATSYLAEVVMTEANANALRFIRSREVPRLFAEPSFRPETISPENVIMGTWQPCGNTTHSSATRGSTTTTTIGSKRCLMKRPTSHGLRYGST